MCAKYWIDTYTMSLVIWILSNNARLSFFFLFCRRSQIVRNSSSESVTRRIFSFESIECVMRWIFSFEGLKIVYFFLYERWWFFTIFETFLVRIFKKFCFFPWKHLLIFKILTETLFRKLVLGSRFAIAVLDSKHCYENCLRYWKLFRNLSVIFTLETI